MRKATRNIVAPHDLVEHAREMSKAGRRFVFDRLCLYASLLLA
jgi:hypothetical protein